MQWPADAFGVAIDAGAPLSHAERGERAAAGTRPEYESERMQQWTRYSEVNPGCPWPLSG